MPKQTSFGQFDTRGAVPKQRAREAASKRAQAENSRRDFEKRKAGREAARLAKRRDRQSTDSNNR